MAHETTAHMEALHMPTWTTEPLPSPAYALALAWHLRAKLPPGAQLTPRQASAKRAYVREGLLELRAAQRYTDPLDQELDAILGDF